MDNEYFIRKLVAVIFALMAGYIFFQMVMQWHQGMVSKNWPKAEGMIIDSQTIQSPGLAAGRSGGQGLRPAYPKLKYSYTVEGTDYIGQKFQFGLQFNRPGLVKQYPKEKAVTVRYNAKKPEKAVLMPGPDKLGLIYMIALGLFFLCVSGIFLAPQVSWKRD